MRHNQRTTVSLAIRLRARQLGARLMARHLTGQCLGGQGRRGEELGFEPLSTAHRTRIKAVLDPAGNPIDWTCEVWAGSHVHRPVFGGNMLAHEALPTPPPAPKPNDP